MPTGTITSVEDSTTIAFLSLRGQVQTIGLELEDISRVGVDGTALREVARKAPPFEMIGIKDCSNIGNVQGTIEGLKDMQGTKIVLTDDYGQEYEQMFLLEVERVACVKIAGATGGTNADSEYLLTVRLKMQAADLV